MVKKGYEFIGKSVYFPKQGIVAIGDLHLGYENMLQAGGLQFPIKQVEQTLEDLRQVLEVVKGRVKKIIFLGDIKHNFGFKKEEKYGLYEVLDLCRDYVSDKDIILIRGNHDKVDLTGAKYHDYWVGGGVGFIHGNRSFDEIWSKDVKIVVMGHLHPTVTLSDEQGVKKEKYKCFLVGKYKRKEFIVAPSFFPVVEGASIEGYEEKFSVVPKEKLRGFKVFVVGEELEVLKFGKLKDLD